MATQTAQPRTQVVKTVETKGLTSKKLETEIGRPLGSPINSMEVGQERKVTLTGKIEIREFNGQKGAYFLTKEGVSIRVNASFDANVHKEGTVHTIVCRLFEQDGRQVKFAAFKDAA